MKNLILWKQISAKSNFVLHPFRINYEVTISKLNVTHMGWVTPFFTNRYVWVGGVEKKTIFIVTQLLKVLIYMNMFHEESKNYLLEYCRNN